MLVFKIIFITCKKHLFRGHRDRYIGSLFRVDGPVPMILIDFTEWQKVQNARIKEYFDKAFIPMGRDS